MNMPQRHRIWIEHELVYQPGGPYHRWLARCECSWTGSNAYSDASIPGGQAADHLRNP